MYKGVNKAIRENLFKIRPQNTPCVFLSHKHEDKPSCRIIANYLSNAEIDYYLDVEDAQLQQAVLNDDPARITNLIKEGIRNSTHMMVVVSARTYKSQWVPFEVGYGHSAIIDKELEKNKVKDKMKLSVLTFSDLSRVELPTFMQVGHIIKGITSLNSFIAEIRGTTDIKLINEGKLEPNWKLTHPLRDILNTTL